MMQSKRHLRALSEPEIDSVIAALADLIVAFLAMNGGPDPVRALPVPAGLHPARREPEKEVLH
jgi:hypothetical protein